MSKDMNLPDNMQSRTDQSLPWNQDDGCPECGADDFDNTDECNNCQRVSESEPHDEGSYYDY